jgi:hypothetical protein
VLARAALPIAVGLVAAAIVSPRALVGARSLVPAGPLLDDPVYAPAFGEHAPRRIGDASGIRVHYPAERFAAG